MELQGKMDCNNRFQHVQQPSFSQGMDYGNTQVLNMEELYSSHDIHDVLRRWAGCFLEVIT
ncbi:hypothetical protein CASFOL_028869 [Castilleja foliolosa]|uniref:Uncharacterized protein n=1 Tax=Castilleja foliolosa TaxID=1961234 RepID=A0ABD3CEQ3_9LAMI